MAEMLSVLPDIHQSKVTSKPGCCWFAVSMLAWGLLGLIGIYWRPSVRRQWPRSCWPRQSAVLPTGFAIAHCTAISLVRYLVGGITFLSSDMQTVVWPFILIGIGIAFLLEWRCGRPSVLALECPRNQNPGSEIRLRKTAQRGGDQ